LGVSPLNQKTEIERWLPIIKDGNIKVE